MRSATTKFGTYLFLSEEYGRHRRRLTDAPGRLFARKIIYHTAARTLAFELLLGAFLRKDCPLDVKLLRFFPALAILPNAAAALARDVANGLSQREIFFRALSQLSSRPSLLLDPAVLSGQDLRVARDDFTQVDERTCLVPCRSRLFASGWQEIEFGASGEFRWMMQIGVLYNPRPESLVERIEISVDACYADPAGVLAFSEGQALRCRLQEKAGGELSLAITADSGSFRMGYLVLIARDASCPLRFNGTPDPRLISISLRNARTSSHWRMWHDEGCHLLLWPPSSRSTSTALGPPIIRTGSPKRNSSAAWRTCRSICIS